MPNEVGTITIRAAFEQVKKATKALRNMGRQSERTEKDVNRVTRASSKLGKTLGRLVAGVSVGLFARKVIANTKEQEQAIAAVNQTLRSTGRYSDEASAALQRQAAALQKLTTYGDEEILRGQDLLLTFKRIGSEVFPRATEAMLDLATKMGTDLKSAALQVGKALEDPATQMTYLVRSGISFTQQQKDMARQLQRSGDLAGAQAIVLKELESQFGGSARAARDTFGGALSAVGNAFNDLLEGDSGGDGVRGATAALNDLADTLQSPEVQAGFQSLISSVATTVTWLAKGVKGFTDFGTGIGEFLGRLTAGPRGSLDAINARIEELQYNLSLPVADGFFRSVAEAFGYDIEEARRKAEQELRELEELRKFFEPKPSDKPDASSPIPFAEVQDPDALLIEVDNEDLKKRLRKATLEFQSELRRVGKTATAEVREALADTSAELAGPAAQANLEYARTLEEIDTWERQLEQSGQLTAERQRELAQLRDNAAEANRRELVTIEELQRQKEAELTPTEELIEALKTELELLKLGASEREREIISRRLAGEATAAQLEEIDKLIIKRQEAEKSIEALDTIRGATQDFLIDAAEGSKSIGDAFEDMFDRIRRRALELATEKLIEKIFGAFGTTGGGSAGGSIFGDVFAGLFGGGRAAGGPISPGRLYRVNEQEPELLTIGSRDYLMAGNRSGNVTPISNTTNSVRNQQTFNINLPPTIPRRTAQQVAFEVQRRNRRATARNT
jgi:hypothetical protein